MEFFGLIGEKLGHSLSEPIHRRIYELLHVPAAYKCMEIPRERLDGVGAAIRLLCLGGVNVTIPYKEALLPQLDELDGTARALGAVNTIKNENGRLMGYNTDVYGFQAMLAFHGIAASGGPEAVLGSGGAAKAAAWALMELGATAVVVSRDPEQKAAAFPGVEVIGYGELEGRTGGLLVNATPVGMWPYTEESPVPESVAARFEAIVDTVYNPWETRLLALARKLHKPCCNGLYMLAAQAVRAEEIFLGRSIPPEITPQIYREMRLLLNA